MLDGGIFIIENYYSFWYWVCFKCFIFNFFWKEGLEGVYIYLGYVGDLLFCLRFRLVLLLFVFV